MKLYKILFNLDDNKFSKYIAEFDVLEETEINYIIKPDELSNKRRYVSKNDINRILIGIGEYSYHAWILDKSIANEIENKVCDKIKERLLVQRNYLKEKFQIMNLEF